jgi:hypothetical protein
VTTLLLGQQILGKQPGTGQRRHLPMETVTRMNRVFSGSAPTLHNEYYISVSRRRRRNENPVPRDINGLPCS